jgi:hypothetical protein
MPQSIAIGLLVLGGVLLLVAVTGGRFKIFGAEVDSAVSSAPVRLTAGLLGVAFVLTSLAQARLGGTSPVQAPANNQPAPSSSTNSGSAGQAKGPESSATPSQKPESVTSSDEYAVVFDPPSNVRVAPTKTSDILCSVTARTSIRILGAEGDWYRTDICDGRTGYIYRNQVKF